MKVWIEQIEGGNLYAFQGSQRSNVTESVIENGQKFVAGAPITLSTNDDLVLVFERHDRKTRGKLRIGA